MSPRRALVVIGGGGLMASLICDFTRKFTFAALMGIGLVIMGTVITMALIVGILSLYLAIYENSWNAARVFLREAWGGLIDLLP